jgi:hypothetical protein
MRAAALTVMNYLVFDSLVDEILHSSILMRAASLIKLWPGYLRVHHKLYHAKGNFEISSFS